MKTAAMDEHLSEHLRQLHAELVREGSIKANFPDFSLPKPFYQEMVKIMSRVHLCAELAYEECYEELEDAEKSLERSGAYILFEGEKIAARDIVTEVAFQTLLNDPRNDRSKK